MSTPKYEIVEIVRYLARQRGIPARAVAEILRDMPDDTRKRKLPVWKAEMQLAGVVPESKSEMDEAEAANRATHSKAWKLGIAAGCNPDAPFPQQIILSDGRVFQKCQRLGSFGHTYIELGRDDRRADVPLEGDDKQARIRYRQALEALEDELFDSAMRAWVEDEGATVVP